MINREDFLKEQLLRENIRRAINIVKQKSLKEESYIRNIIRSLLSEATTFKYEYTSLNQLAHFIKEVVGDPAKPDSNPAFKDAYTDLTSDHKDREQFVEFIIDFADEDFNTIDADREPQALGQDFVEKGFSLDDGVEEEDPEDKDQMIKLSIEDLEGSGGDVTQKPEDEEDEEDEIFSIGEDGEIIEDSEDELESNKRFARESYKRIGPVLRRYYLNVPKNSPLKKDVQIDNEEYPAGDLSERDLFKIYFKKNMALWAARYEEEFFNDTPDTNIDIDSQEDTNSDEIEDITPEDAPIADNSEEEDENMSLDSLLE